MKKYFGACTVRAKADKGLHTFNDSCDGIERSLGLRDERLFEYCPFNLLIISYL
jgi:hypothetical protein